MYRLKEKTSVSVMVLDLKARGWASTLLDWSAGLVAMLTRHIADSGGNVTHSKMNRLGSEFVIQMHVAVQPNKVDTFLSCLQNELMSRELNVHATRLTQRSKENSTAVMGLRIHCVGADR